MIHSGDECLKFISCLTEWALPEKRSLAGRTDTNFDYRAPVPEVSTTAAVKSANANGSAVTSTRTRYIAPFNLAFNTQLGYFPWLELPENEGRFVRFGHAMTGTRQWEIKNQILQGANPSQYMRGFVSNYNACGRIAPVSDRLFVGRPPARLGARRRGRGHRRPVDPRRTSTPTRSRRR